MTPTSAPRAATCQQCSWHATGTTAWTDGDAHAAATGHTVVRTGTDTGTHPTPYTQPFDGNH